MNPPGVDHEGGAGGDPAAGAGGMGGGPGGFPSVKLRGLPFDVMEDDLKMFLGCDPVDILMVHRDGRLSGEAFVILASPMHVELALSKNRSYLGRRYIEVYRTQKMDYYRAVAAEMMDGQGGQYAGYGGGGGYGAPPMPSHMGMYDQRGYGAQQGYGGQQAYGGGGMPQRGYAQRPYGGGMPQPGGYPAGPAGGGGTAGTTILKLRGLPFSVQDDDIVQWFADPSLGISPLTADSVFIVQENGRANGIAFVELPTSAEASAAMAKNKQMMGSRYVEIFPASKADLDKYQNQARGY